MAKRRSAAQKAVTARLSKKGKMKPKKKDCSCKKKRRTTSPAGIAAWKKTLRENACTSL